METLPKSKSLVPAQRTKDREFLEAMHSNEACATTHIVSDANDIALKADGSVVTHSTSASMPERSPPVTDPAGE
ncbi:unnamed protein product [Dibothriocephalus latus]|uniref:Uncharacterized protein n=1 Tax=Dibothriocephalus latus TaxID=60516 RepID=A0A3P7NPY0_DIBLA|nr:unnamed protein product [Dibothriocephalus latus]